jgi:hypothetical protein
MEHQAWRMEADQTLGPLIEAKTAEQKETWNNLNDALNTKLNGPVNVKDYGEVNNHGSILLLCHQLLNDGLINIYRGNRGTGTELTRRVVKKAKAILGYDIAMNGDTPFMKRITADTVRDAIRIFEQDYRTFLEALWGDKAARGSRLYFVEDLEIRFDIQDQLHCNVSIGT